MNKFALPTEDESYKQRLFSFIKETIRNYYKAPENVYEMKTRKREYLKVKHYAAYFCLTIPDTTLCEIGTIFGLHHASIIHVKKKVSGYLEFDRGLKKEFNEIRNLINTKAFGETAKDEDVYFIDLNSVHSIKHTEGKAIILAGFTDEEAANIRFLTSFDGLDMFDLWGNPEKIVRKHENTGMYILDKQ